MAPKTKIVVIGASYGPDIWHSRLVEVDCRVSGVFELMVQR